jgi:hypothetical protein
MFYWNNELDKELIELYKISNKAVNEFSVKYSIGIGKIYYRLTVLGIRRRSISDVTSGENHYNWKNEKYKYVSKRSGYVFVKVGDKWIPEHILVMEKKLGRKLKRNEIVHHIDESFEARSNNKENNLQLTTRAEHGKHHKKGKGKGYCISFLKYVGKWVLIVRNNITGKWSNFGRYESKEQALEAFSSGIRVDRRTKSYHVSKENVGVGK